MKSKWRCRDCHHVTTELLIAKNPFDPQYYISGCPKCLQCESGFDCLCDDDGCQEVYSAGWPSDEGYRMTCHKHTNFNAYFERHDGK
jgi:hypothetical protein